MRKYDKFYQYLEELHQNHVHLSGLLVAKLDAVIEADLDRLDKIIKEEQVFVLVSKSFDSNLKRFKQELSLSGDTLSQIVTELPPEERQRFRDLFERLKLSLEETKALNQKSQDLLDQYLHKINKSIKALDKNHGASYGKASESNGDRPRLFTQSV